ncbi:MAG: ParB/RepB/Spo0J family partition protein [Chelatococcus sp.]|jgi:ParB family chromosome partitioning protein|uniref:ParB/RepB/Spo0J family partition protein n=1 Tax=unclassified Chelatococcus TaxID=2638111 RepID=UPI001BCB5024|nr:MULTISPECIES: ParB/RepB/Spo0J family partition protein [unclassified Chelatococcus]CAH1657262.1 Chromosome-partitioning protein ParB [Hyphomicrobiales bacterium]MBS7740656.1 ParB/RepB/Spo0J family partition protein [Chelatococcus sp. HY11]MBX3539186.1 ParB/RepB/Spo0J family partition protein [Chelatococcus sp.]MBX3544560.1 ParB/RepB/Spo0J family partition protein [Chelatococcus sp.]MCO5079857.1 ParB/RepB/Spo0J family partition protein [Chelatococcus sp.]
MADDPARSRLGRGLAALIGDVGEEFGALERTRTPGQRLVPVEFLRPNPRNPRKAFVEEDLSELADSIRQRGVIQPIVVRSLPHLIDVFEIIAGERRWRAAQRAGLHEVPVVVIEADDKTALEIAIIENVQRADLNPMEEAAGYERLIADFDYSQNDLAQVIGKSRSHVANTLRLLKLPTGVKDLVNDGQLSAGHARALLGLEDPESVARQVIEKGLNVRDVERIAQDEARDSGKPSVPRARAKAEKDPDTRALEKALEDVLGLTVTINHQARGGEMRIRYLTLDQLDALCRRLQG